MRIEEEIKQGRNFENPYERLVVNIMFTNSWVVDEQTKVFRPFGLTNPQYNVLRILRGQYPDVCTVNTIIERMIDRMSNASRIVDRLELKNLVERTVCKTDRRAKDVRITEKGLLLLEQVDQALTDWLKRLTHLSEDQVNQLNENLDALRSK
ncbi:MarR family winged helix-turn-helix transcriptional regulator [Roseivirga sp.]|uniref:MarR family winged helix-turn-helix transcriptional regulator n=1 Tax=Roseivirga sp. TaxID=1964215 RepID=UPI003B8CF6F7